MPTDTEAAAAWLVLADKADEQGLTRIAADRRRIAAELDPPKPVHPDGLYAWVTYTHELYTDGNAYYRALAQYDAEQGEWVMERTRTGASCTVVANNVTKVEPLRVIDDQYVAVPVVTLATKTLVHDAEHLDREFGYGCKSSAVLRAYIEAVEAAQAGDRS